jgi:hypothetical protein
MTDVAFPRPSSAPPALPNDRRGPAASARGALGGVAGRSRWYRPQPGAGKTVTVASWVARARRPARWRGVAGRRGRDRHRFWRLVAAALDLGVAVPRRGDLAATLDALCQAIASREEPVVLVLDDFHEVDHEVAADVDRLLAQSGRHCGSSS